MNQKHHIDIEKLTADSKAEPDEPAAIDAAEPAPDSVQGPRGRHPGYEDDISDPTPRNHAEHIDQAKRRGGLDGEADYKRLIRRNPHELTLRKYR